MTTVLDSTTSKLSADNIDDLVYACRTNDVDWLKEYIPRWAGQLNTTNSEIVKSAVDMDEDGMGSRACLLHYPAANGNLDLVTYLLETLSVGESSGTTETNDEDMGHSTATTTQEQPARHQADLVNHQNVSGNTPLHWAALNGHLEIVKALVQAGADPTIVNEAGRDAVVEAEYSSKESAAECANWLLKECESLERGAHGAQASEGQPCPEEHDKIDADVEQTQINGDSG